MREALSQNVTGERHRTMVSTVGLCDDLAFDQLAHREIWLHQPKSRNNNSGEIGR